MAARAEIASFYYIDADLVDRVVQRRKRHADHQFALLYLDLDRFAMVTESLGH